MNEAFLKLIGAEVPWSDRAHFFAISARIMRQILVDHAKRHKRLKRGGAAVKVSLEDGPPISAHPEERLLDIDEALSRLAEIDPRKAQLIEMVYFAGVNQAEAAEVLGVSEATVQRDLRMAKAWLYRALKPPG